MRGRPEIWITVASGLFITAVLVMFGDPNAESSFDFRRSTKLTGPQNSSGLAEMIDGLGVATEERLRPFLQPETPDSSTLLALLSPVGQPNNLELRNLVEFVERGGNLLLGNTSSVFDCLGVETRWSGDDTDSVTFSGRTIPLELTGTPVFNSKGEKDDDPERQECPVTRTVVFDTIATVGEKRRPVALEGRLGEGRVLLFATTAWVANETLKETDIATVFLPWILDDGISTVVFDEYHHGFGEGGSIWRAFWDWLIRDHTGNVLLHLLVATLLFLVFLSIRFGPPGRALSRERRSELEHVDALAATLSAAGAAQTSAGLLAGGLRRRLAGITERDTGGRWLSTLKDSGGPIDKLLADLKEVDRLDAPTRTLATANLMEEIWTTIRFPIRQNKS